jgi:signal transduction histidine kinase
VGGHVSVTAVRERDGALVAVSDDGPGLPQEIRDGARPFATTKPGGLGLGLPLVRKIVALHGGTVTMHERSPRGLEVQLRLPIKQPVIAVPDEP